MAWRFRYRPAVVPGAGLKRISTRISTQSFVNRSAEGKRWTYNHATLEIVKLLMLDVSGKRVTKKYQDEIAIGELYILLMCFY